MTDSARVTRVTRVVAVASTARSGSTLLCRALAGSGVAGDPKEYLNPGRLQDDLRSVPFGDVSVRGLVGQFRRRLRGDPDWRRVVLTRLSKRARHRYVHDLGVRHATDNGVFGIKFMWPQYRALLDLGYGADVWGAPVSWVSIRRVDHLRQAVSWCKAEQSKQWSSGGKRHAPMHYEPARIAELLQILVDQERSWDEFFTQIGVTPIAVTYEQLDADYEGTVTSVLAQLGFPGALVVPRAIERQADEVTEEWIERFTSERGGGPTR